MTSKLSVYFQRFLNDAADTRWPWREQRRQVKHLSAVELMRHATQLLTSSGRSRVAARLVYHAILQDSAQVDALLCMSDFLASDDPDHFSIDLKPYAAVTLEYALRSKNRIKPEGVARIHSARLKLMMKMGHATFQKGKKVPEERDYSDATRFDIDELSYISDIMPSVNEIGSIPDAFKLAHAFLGVYAGLLLYRREPGRSTHISLTSFDLSPDFYSWLRSDPKTLARQHFDRKRNQFAA